jgi:hypothetical protein
MPEFLHPDSVVEEAQRRTGLTEFDSQSFRDGLSLLLSEANRCDRVTASGRTAIYEQAVGALAIRLRVTDYVRRHPEVLDEKIERPVVVLGQPRTGTTLSANLLANDPARRSLLSWILNDPIPPPTLETLKTDPRCLAQLERERLQREKDPSSGRFYRSSADYPMECVMLHRHDFKSLAWEAAFPMPAYSDFVLNGDMGTAYKYHKLVLQILQSKAPGGWQLKMPSHALHIRAVIETYPDARLVWTHRDPFTAMGSLMSLISHSQTFHTDNNPDNDYIGRHYPAQIAAHLDRMIDFMKARPDVTIHHLHYADMTRDPIGEMRRLYATLGDDFTPAVEAGMSAWLADNPQGKYGKHAYTLERFGHTEASIRPYFDNYLAHFQVEREGL